MVPPLHRPTGSWLRGILGERPPCEERARKEERRERCPVVTGTAWTYNKKKEPPLR